jgi:tRNA(adenine34) deaminase
VNSSLAASQAQVDERWMALAIAQAAMAAQEGEVPVGAIVVFEDRVLAFGRNQCLTSHDPTGHAEIVALRQAGSERSNYRLLGCTVYVTLEPCVMCAGALLNARVDRVVFGVREPKSGAAGSVLDLFGMRQFNHHTKVYGGVLEAQCASLLANFFSERRLAIKQASQPLREDALRTPEFFFNALPANYFPSKFIVNLPALCGFRLHYLDEGPLNASEVHLCLHSNNGWGFEFWGAIHSLVSSGIRVIVPDLVGFGRSDKPKRSSLHTVDFHAGYLVDLLSTLEGVMNVVIVHPDQCGDNEKYKDIPFPDRGFRAALVAFGPDKVNTFSIGQRVMELLTDRR